MPALHVDADMFGATSAFQYGEPPCLTLSCPALSCPVLPCLALQLAPRRRAPLIM